MVVSALPPVSYTHLLGLYLGDVGAKNYRYARYSFSNPSDDIRGILCEHLDLLGIGWTRPNAHQIAVDPAQRSRSWARSSVQSADEP